MFKRLLNFVKGEEGQEEKNNQKKQTVKAGTRMVAQKAIKFLAKLIKQIIAAIIKFIVAFFPFIIIIVLCAFLVFEFDGKNLNYTNTDEEVQDEVGKESNRKITADDKILIDYYTYMGLQSFYKVDPKNSEKLLNGIENDDLRDYWERETEYAINHNLLMSLDKFLFDGLWMYPEQFIKPVNHDLKTFKLLPIADKDGSVIAKSKPINIETGEIIEKEEPGVWDYGLGSIFKYREMEISRKLKGKYVKEDFINEDGEIEQREIEPIEYEIEVPLPDKDPKYVFDEALTISGKLKFNYERDESLLEGVQVGESENEDDNVIKIAYGKGIVRELDREASINEGRDVFTEREVTLYRYRDNESGLFEEVDRPSEVVKLDENDEPIESQEENDKERLDYFYDYLRNFETYIPNKVMDFKYIKSQIDEDKLKEIEESAGAELEDLKAGSASSSPNLKNVIANYGPTIEKYAKKYGVDAPIIAALIAQESGGRNDHKDGIAQITGDNPCITYRGETHCVPNKKDTDASIKYMVMRIKKATETYQNVGLALLSYNQGDGAAQYIMKNYPESIKDGSWINHVEEARDYFGRKYWGKPSRSANQTCIKPKDRKANDLVVYGDACYLQNVMRYCVGKGCDKVMKNVKVITEVDEDGHVVEKEEVQKEKKTIKDWIKSKLSSFWEDIMEIFDPYVPTDGYKRFANHLGISVIDDIRDYSRSFTNKEYFFKEEGKNQDGVSTNMNIIDDEFFGSASSHPKIDRLSELSGKGEFIPPLEGTLTISSPFGRRNAIVDKKTTSKKEFHLGVDVPKPQGTPVFAVKEGTIIQVRTNIYSSYGINVLIDHGDGIRTRYAHLSQALVREGEKIKQGEVIGLVGSTGNSTGPHLHFELIINGVHRDGAAIIRGDYVNND